MRLRRGRLDDLVRRQLDLFAEDEAALLEEAAAADAAWTNASAEDSEELYGDYQLIADAVGDRLYEVRETYARTLSDDVTDEYRRSFDKATRKRFGGLAIFLEDS